MKILFLYNSSFTVRHMRAPLMRTMRAEGHEVIACVPAGNTQLREELAVDGIELEYVPLQKASLNPFRDFIYFLSLIRTMRRLKPQMVFAATIKPIVFGSLAAKLCGIRVASMVTGLGYTFLTRSFASRIAKALYRWALIANERVFFQNEDDRETFRSLRIFADDDRSVTLAGSGVDLDEFSWQEAPIDPVSFIYIGRLLRDKGIGEYLEAAALLKRKFPKALFRLVGGFDENPASIDPNVLWEHTRREAIEWWENLTDVRPLLRKTSVFVLPSYREGTSRAVLEALATGRPVVTTTAPGCRQTVEDGVNGFTVAPKNVEALAEAMERFIVNPSLIRAFGIESRKLAEKKFDRRKVNAKILKSLRLARLPENVSLPEESLLEVNA